MSVLITFLISVTLGDHGLFTIDNKNKKTVGHFVGDRRSVTKRIFTEKEGYSMGHHEVVVTNFLLVTHIKTSYRFVTF